MRRVVLLFLGLLLGHLSFAQKDKVYLNNGSVLIGHVKMNATNDSLKLKINNQTILLAFSEVDEVKIRKEGFRANYTNKCSFSRGYVGSLRLGALVGGQQNESTATTLSVSTYHGYQFSPLLNISLGTGFGQYRDYNTLPVFLRYQATLGRARLAPFLYAELGHGLVKGRDEWTNVKKGGLYYNIGGGLQKKMGKNYIRIEGGVQVQRLEEELPQFGIWSWDVMPGGNYVVQKRELTRAVISLSYVW